MPLMRGLHRWDIRKIREEMPDAAAPWLSSRNWVKGEMAPFHWNPEIIQTSVLGARQSALVVSIRYAL